jgi:D-glucosaminate-specific PTS system IIC component
MGDVQNGLLIGATIQVIYMGMIAPGANIPADPNMAAIIAIPLALKTGMSAETAVAIAVPFGVIGVFIDQLRRTLNAAWFHMGDRAAEAADADRIVWLAWCPPLILNFFLRFTPVFLMNLVPAERVNDILESMPQWLLHGLGVAGGIMPAMGFAITMMIIGKATLFPFFFLGFFIVQYLKINVMAAAIFGGCISVLAITLKNREGRPA